LGRLAAFLVRGLAGLSKATHSPPPVDAIAAAALSRVLGETPAITLGERLSNEQSRNPSLRATVRTGDGNVLRVVLRTAGSSDAETAPVEMFENSGLVREWAALSLLNEGATGEPYAARLLADDLDHDVLVLEDIGRGGRQLVGPLLHGSADEAEAALLAHASALGRMHADTLGCAGRHAAIVAARFPEALVPPCIRLERVRARIVEITQWTGWASPPPDELEALVAQLAAPGPWQVLLHHDPCPDNSLIAGAAARLVDFEYAMPGHGLLDLACCSSGFLTCWCAGALPASVIAALEQTYRRELARQLPEAMDDRCFANEMDAASIALLLTNLAWLLEAALQTDPKWGLARNRTRLLFQLRTVTNRPLPRFPGIQRSFAEWLSDLRSRWPDTEELAPYPAFMDDD
jgi:hypothetical protein